MLSPHPGRVQPPCRYYGVCGGCDFQHATYELQLKLKQDILTDALKRTAGIDIPDIEITPSSPWGCRRRVRFHRAGGRLGFRERSSSRAVQIDTCMVLDPRLDALLRGKTEDLDISGSLLAGEHHIGDAARSTTLLLSDSFGHEHLLEADGSVFFQSNVEAFTPVLDMIQEAQYGKSALDLFSGVGTFAAFLADRFDLVTAVERDPRCLAYAQQNLPPAVQYITSSVEKWSKSSPAGLISLVVVDPPRTGIDRRALRTLLSWKPHQILSVSCDPVTFSRDLKIMLQAGYRIDSLKGVDLYPQTSHVECAALMSRVEK